MALAGEVRRSGRRRCVDRRGRRCVAVGARRPRPGGGRRHRRRRIVSRTPRRLARARHSGDGHDVHGRRRGDARRRPAVRSPTVLGALGAGLDVAAVVMAVGTVGTLLRPRLARTVAPIAVAAGAVTARWRSASPATRPRARGCCRQCRRCRCRRSRFFASAGETVLLALALGPLVAAGLWRGRCSARASTSGGRLRWLALCLVTGLGAIAIFQLVRLLGPLEWATASSPPCPGRWRGRRSLPGAATTIVQPELGDAAIAVRQVAVGVGLVSILGAAGGLAWFAADATTAHIVPGAPAAATVLTIAALLLPVRDRLERVADRWLFGEVGSDARLIDTFGAAAEHAGRSEVLELLVSTARRALRLRWARASTAGVVPVVAAVGVGSRRAATGHRPLPADGERRAARSARVWAEARWPAQRPRSPAPRRPRSRGRSSTAHRQPGGRARGAAEPDRSARRPRSRPPGRASSRPRTRSAGGSNATSTTGSSKSWHR